MKHQEIKSTNPPYWVKSDNDKSYIYYSKKDEHSNYIKLSKLVEMYYSGYWTVAIFTANDRDNSVSLFFETGLELFELYERVSPNSDILRKCIVAAFEGVQSNQTIRKEFNYV